jgi:hypothetical protein
MPLICLFAGPDVVVGPELLGGATPTPNVKGVLDWVGVVVEDAGLALKLNENCCPCVEVGVTGFAEDGAEAKGFGGTALIAGAPKAGVGNGAWKGEGVPAANGVG